MYIEMPFTFTDNATLKTAADEWSSDPTSATATYGHIRDWDVSQVTGYERDV